MTNPRRVLIALFRSDLRVHDNPILHRHAQSKATHLLPLYIFDPAIFDLTHVKGLSRDEKEKERDKAPKTGVLGLPKTGALRTKFIVESVFDLQNTLRAKHDSDLVIAYGDPVSVLTEVVKHIQSKGAHVEGVQMSKEYTSEELSVERSISRALSSLSSASPSSPSSSDAPPTLKFFHTKTLIHPHDVPFSSNISDCPDGYTAFRKVVEGMGDEMVRPCMGDEELMPFPREESVDTRGVKVCGNIEETMEQLLAPFSSSSSSNQNPLFKGGESSALSRLEHYVPSESSPGGGPIATYKQTRNGLLGDDFSSKFSPFLACGSLSPRMIWESLDNWDSATEGGRGTKDSYWLRFELLWRDYFVFVARKYGNDFFKLGGIQSSLNPNKYSRESDSNSGKHSRDSKTHRSGNKDKHGEKKKEKQAESEWKDPTNGNGKKDLDAWMEGRTGVPFIDANMIELAQTGYMSNRGRQNVASFLTKDLYVDWRAGAEVFETLLLDYDPCSNYGNWMYVAGVGTDPRDGRQFNPIKQGKDYDPSGEYIKYWIPSLKNVEEKYIHHPWTSPSSSSSTSSAAPSSTPAPSSAESNTIPDLYSSPPPSESRAWKAQYGRVVGEGSKKGVENGSEDVERGHRHHGGQAGGGGRRGWKRGGGGRRRSGGQNA